MRRAEEFQGSQEGQSPFAKYGDNFCLSLYFATAIRRKAHYRGKQESSGSVGKKYKQPIRKKD